MFLHASDSLSMKATFSIVHGIARELKCSKKCPCILSLAIHVTCQKVFGPNLHKSVYRGEEQIAQFSRI